jgi:hypothetical protein
MTIYAASPVGPGVAPCGAPDRAPDADQPPAHAVEMSAIADGVSRQYPS